MKKSVLSLAVAAGVTGVMSAAHADMYINDNGLGETLVFPYYSAQNGNDTLINVVNTTGHSKAVKVRVLEAENSQEVIDFNVYMSPEDHFSFAITATADGGAELRTIDNTCTVPAIPSAGAFKAVQFRTTQYAGDKGTGFDNTGIERTQVGYIEVIEMGQVVDASVIDTAMTHGVSGMPADCSVLVDAWTGVGTSGGAWYEDALSGSKGTSFMESTWMGGGLYGFGTVINVAEGTAFGYDAVAIDAIVEAGQTGSALHYPPGDTRPDFTDAALANTAITEVDGSSVVSTFALGEEVLAVGSLFMATELINDYVVDPGLNAATDWIITQPTKAFHVQTAPTIVPYSVAWNGQTACEPMSLTTLDREEAVTAPQTGSVDFSPAPPVPVVNNDLPLCYEMTVLQFGEDAATNTGLVATGINSVLDYTEGWASISFDPDALDDDSDILAHRRVLTPASGVSQEGLPVTGFAAIKYTNGALGSGTLANYSISTEHKSSVVTSTVAP
jgi:hypothetical protein